MSSSLGPKLGLKDWVSDSANTAVGRMDPDFVGDIGQQPRPLTARPQQQIDLGIPMLVSTRWSLVRDVSSTEYPSNMK